MTHPSHRCVRIVQASYIRPCVYKEIHHAFDADFLDCNQTFYGRTPVMIVEAYDHSATTRGLVFKNLTAN